MNSFTFRRAGLETMVLKGAALVALYFQDCGARPMDDVDLLVPPENVRPAIRRLGELGSVSRTPLDGLTESDVLWSKAFHFRNKTGCQLDLHAHLLPQAPTPDADGDCWHGAIRARIGGADARALNPADELLHVCVHGSGWNEIPPLRMGVSRLPPAFLESGSPGNNSNWSSKTGFEANRKVATCFVLASPRG